MHRAELPGEQEGPEVVHRPMDLEAIVGHALADADPGVVDQDVQ